MALLPEISLESFSEHLAAAAPEAFRVDPELAKGLFAHYLELRRWAPRVDLIGPGAAGEIFEHHYGESLAALPWLPHCPFRLLDLGSGAGFPGMMLAAARRDAEVWLVEPRQRRAAFLATAARKMGLEVHCLNARVAAPALSGFPERIDVVTLRALRLPPRDFRALLPHLAEDARVLLWAAADPPELPRELTPSRRSLLKGSHGRYLHEYRRAKETP